MSVESNNVEEIGQGLAPDVVPQVPDPGVEVVPAGDLVVLSQRQCINHLQSHMLHD